jgi:RimJ/RimL family protein N-acetyltransferase
VGVATTPYRIETERLVIRCYDPRDAPLLNETVAASAAHLAEWMPWARLPRQTVAETVQLLRTFRGQFDHDENYVYGIYSRDESALLGGTGLHKRSNDGSLEIGYWVAASALRQGIATEVTAVLTRVGFELMGLDRVDLQIDPRNERSLKIPRKLGFAHDGTIRRRLEPGAEGEPRRDSAIFTMLREELATSPCAAYGYVAYDAAGNRLGGDNLV